MGEPTYFEPVLSRNSIGLWTRSFILLKRHRLMFRRKVLPTSANRAKPQTSVSQRDNPLQALPCHQHKAGNTNRLQHSQGRWHHEARLQPRRKERRFQAGDSDIFGRRQHLGRQSAGTSIVQRQGPIQVRCPKMTRLRLGYGAASEWLRRVKSLNR